MVTQVDFILLHIRTFDFSTVNGEDYRINFSGWWDIFGTPGPAFDGPYARPDVAVPEPGSLPLMLLGLIAFAYRAWRRSHRPLESFRP
jgi:hypothetical protein